MCHALTHHSLHEYMDNQRGLDNLIAPWRWAAVYSIKPLPFSYFRWTSSDLLIMLMYVQAFSHQFDFNYLML